MKSFYNKYLINDFNRNFFFLSIVMLLFLAFRTANGNYRLVDSDEYFELASIIKKGHYFSHTSDINQAISLTKRTFLYPLILLLGFSNDLFVVILQTFIGLLNLYLTMRLFEKLGGKSFKTLSLFLVLTPAIFIYTHLIMTEVFAMTLFLLLAFLLLEKFTAKSIFFIQVVLSILLFLKPAFYLFSILNILFFLIYFFRTKMFQISVFLPLILSLSYIAINKQRTDYAHFSSIQNINLIDYNCYLFKMKKEGIEAADNWKIDIYTKTEKFPTFKTKSEFLASEGKKIIKENLVSYSIFHFIGAIRGAIDPGRFDLMTFAHKDDENAGFMKKLNGKNFKEIVASFKDYKYKWVLILLIPVLILNFLKWFLILIHMFKNRKLLNYENAFLIVLISYSILISGPVNTARYMMPLQGILISFAIISLENFKHKKSST